MSILRGRARGCSRACTRFLFWAICSLLFSHLLLPAPPLWAQATITGSSSTTLLAIPSDGPAFVSGAVDDPTDPAATIGINFTVDPADLTVSATSSADAVVSNANLALADGGGGQWTLTIKSKEPGKTTITVVAGEGGNQATYTIEYAASAASVTPPLTRFHTGANEASAAVGISSQLMWVADDEDNVLRLYERHKSGLPIRGKDMTADLEVGDKVDFEAATRSGNRIYWLGSHSNSGNAGDPRLDRHRLFATDLIGSDDSSTLDFVGYYNGLRDDLLAWDSRDDVPGKDANSLGLTASAAKGVIPEDPDGKGFNIEGLAMAPNGTAAYIGFREPLVPPGNHTKALVVPLKNMDALVNGLAVEAEFDLPIELDLGGRGIRSMECNATECLIVAGPAATSKESDVGPSDFVLYRWSGNPNDAPELLTDATNLTNRQPSGGSFESIVEAPASLPLDGQSPVQLLVDNGGSSWASAFSGNWHKFRSEQVLLGTQQPDPDPVPDNTVERRVAQSSDDAEEYSPTEPVYLDSTDLELTQDANRGDVPQTVGIRFTDLAIPPKATITSAYVEFTVEDPGADATSVQIAGQAAGNPSTFAAGLLDISTRSLTSAKVDWTAIGAWSAAGEKHQTPDLSTIVQELVNRNDWASGNAMVFVFTGTGRRTATSYDGDPQGAPLLHIVYEEADAIAVTVTVQDEHNVPVGAGVNVAVNLNGSPTGKVGQTDGSGQVVFNLLAAGDYTFDVTVNGSTYSSAACTVPGCSSATVTAPAAPAAATALYLPIALADVGAPPTTSSSTTLIAENAQWKYRDDGQDQGTTWRQVNGFDDSSWDSGPAQLGYGDGDEAKQVGFGGDANAKFITTYFRHTFTVTDPDAYKALDLRLLRDDGAVVYLNGAEVARSNMPEGEITYQTPAISSVTDDAEDTVFLYTVDPSLLDQGENVLAVEVHQVSQTSSDLSFRLSLEGSPQTAVRFAVIGDYGNDLNTIKDPITNQNVGTEAAVAALVRNWRPDFVITTGDNNYNVGAAATMNANVIKHYGDFITEDLATTRFFPSLGNHDWETPGATPYLDTFVLPGNERYYDFTRGDVHFFAVDSDSREPDGIAPDSVQGQWLQQALDDSESTWKLVYFHHPPYSSGDHGSQTSMQWPYKVWGASAVLGGHDHNYERLTADGLPYFVNGSGGQALRKCTVPLPADVADKSHICYVGDYGAMLVEAHDGIMTFLFISRRDAVIDSCTLPGTCQEPPG